MPSKPKASRGRRQSLQLSQNYLKNPSLVRYLIGLSDLDSDDVVLDIGAGSGIISTELSQVVSTVVAIEKDLKSYQKLQRSLAAENVELVYGDALKFAINAEANYKIFSNPPFRITSQLVKHFLLETPFPISAYLVMQRQAAERIIGSKHRNLISTLLNTLYIPRIIHNFSSSDFSPEPKVPVVFAEFILKPDLPRVIINKWPEYSDLLRQLYTEPILPLEQKIVIVTKRKIILPQQYRSKNALELSSDEWVKLVIDSKILD